VILPSFLLALALAPQVGTLPERQPPRDAPPRADAAGTGIIRGHVVAADTGLPIRRAHVTLSMTQPPPAVAVGNASPPALRAAPPMNFGTRQTLADAEGAFEFKNLPPGGYMVHASPWQFSGQYLGLPFGAQHPGPGVSGTPIHLAPGQVFDRATIALPRGAVIVGRVTDDMGQPIARAQVYGMWFLRGSKRGMRNGVGAQTDDLGQFRIYGLEPGDYVVVAEARSPTFVPPNANSMMPDNEESTGMLTTYYPGTADVAAAQHLRTTVGRELDGIEIRMVQGRLYRLSGIVLDSQGKPSSNVYASLVQRTPGGFTGGSGFETDAQGRFQMRNVAPGTYRVIVRPRFEDGKPNVEAESANLPLTVNADLENILITTTPAVSVNGQIVFDPGPPPESSGPLRVSAVPGDPNEIYGPRPEAAVVQPDLTFTLKGLMGEFVLRTGRPGAFLKSVLLGGEDITDVPHEFKPGDKVTIVLTSRASTLEGTLLGSSGAPTPDAGVVLFPEDKALWRANSIRVQMTVSDVNGHFRIRGLRAGRYYLLAGRRERVFLAGPLQDTSYFEGLVKDATIVVVGEDEQRTIDLRLVEPGG
jgi:protocatechuate 3,4-dioxygenase beta subunit